MTIKTFLGRIAVAGCLLAATEISHAQLAATISDFGPAAPTPGANDQSQLLFSLVAGNPTGINYYWDNASPPGSTFTTGANGSGYMMNSLMFKTQGGGGGSFGNSQPYQLRVYSVANNTNATLIAFYQTQIFGFTGADGGAEGDWLQVSGLNLALSPNTTYAYTFGRTAGGTGWENLGNTNGNPYAGGAACTITKTGGTGAVLYTNNPPIFDATFDVALTPASGFTVNPPILSAASPINQGTMLTLTAGIVLGNNGAYTYQWQTDGGSGTLTNIPGATSSTFSVNTTSMNLGVYFQYALKVVDSSSATTTSLPVGFYLVATLSGTLTDIGTGVPTAGGSDASQLLGGQLVTGGLNYYTDNSTPPGQTFITGGNGKGYSLNSVALELNGGTSSGTATLQGYDLFLFAISADGSTATLMADVTNLNFSFNYGDWVRWNFPPITLNSNSVYAYTFHRRTTGWAGLSTSPGTSDVYVGGQIALIPSAGGAVSYSATPGLDGTFDVGLIPIGVSILLNLPTATPNPAYALTPVKLSDMPSTPGIFSYHWLTDDGSGSVPPNYHSIAGATSTNLTVIPFDLYPGGSDYTTNYYFVATDTIGGSSITSSVVTLTVHPASVPVFTALPALTNLVTFAQQGSVSYSVSEDGTKPITNQWQLDSGSGFVSLGTQTNTTLTLSNLKTSDSGTYQLVATNVIGTTNTAVTLTVLPAPAAPILGQTYYNEVYTNHPWAYWRLNETGDPTVFGAPVYTAYDYSGHGFDPTYGNAVTVNNPGPQPPTFPGFDANELAAGTSLSTPNSYLTVPALNLTGNTNLTFMAWINPNGPQGLYSGIFFNRGGPDNACGFGFGGVSDHLGYTWNNNSAATYGWDSTLAVAENQWNFVAYVITPTNTTVYLGNLSGGVTNFLQANNPVANTGESFQGGTILLGGDTQDINRNFSGLISEAVLFTNALTTAQIQQYFLAAVGATALAPSVIAQASPSANVYSGQNVLLTGSASGSAPLTNHWQSSPDGGIWTDIPGATNNTLLINPITVGTVYYQLVSTNVVGSATSSLIPITFNALPTTPPGVWTANFELTNNFFGGTPGTGGVGHYVGRGILGTGMYWNLLPDVAVDSTGLNFTSVSDLLDDGVTHSGVYCEMFNMAGFDSATASLPYSSDIGNLLDQYAQCLSAAGALQFVGVPDGTYNLVIFGADGTYADRGTSFTVYDSQNGNQTESTLNAAPETALLEGNNFVTFTHVHVAGGMLVVDVNPNPDAHGGNTEADINGAQIQLVSLDVPAPTVTINSTVSGSTMSLNWTQGILQTATNLLGPWTPIYSPAPITINTTNAAQFYRIKVQ